MALSWSLRGLEQLQLVRIFLTVINLNDNLSRFVRRNFTGEIFQANLGRQQPMRKRHLVCCKFSPLSVGWCEI
jgi:hypothetical protein